MRVEDFNQPAARMTDARAGHAFANIPIAAPEGSWSAVQWVPEHRASLNGPFGEDYEATTDGTREVEFAVREHRRRLFAQVEVVRVDPEFLEGDDFVGWGGTGDAQGDFVEAGYSVFGDVFELWMVILVVEELHGGRGRKLTPQQFIENTRMELEALSSAIVTYLRTVIWWYRE